MTCSGFSVRWFIVAALLAAFGGGYASVAQAQQGPRVVSPQVADDGSVTFRVHAPSAESVRLASSDIPGLGQDRAAMTVGDQDVWEITVGPLDPGAYRYTFNVDGVTVMDPRNPRVSEANDNAFSLVYVPGAPFMDTNGVGHGVVGQVTYRSSVLEKDRRMHVYTPPGYQRGEGTFPVLYLLHGATDSDHSWATVGRANYILDNLIAEGEAEPMIVVMPHGHTGPFRFGQGLNMSDFVDEFEQDIRPYIEEHYRVRTDRNSRAVAGLSMGGAQSLDIAFRNLDDFGYLGVFSSGVFGITGRGPGGNRGPSWTETHADALDNESLRDGLKLVWFATGRDDFLLETTEATVETLRDHGFDVTYEETGGGHTWRNWREYLHVFAPQLFK